MILSVVCWRSTSARADQRGVGPVLGRLRALLRRVDAAAEVEDDQLETCDVVREVVREETRILRFTSQLAGEDHRILRVSSRRWGRGIVAAREVAQRRVDRALAVGATVAVGLAVPLVVPHQGRLAEEAVRLRGVSVGEPEEVIDQAEVTRTVVTAMTAEVAPVVQRAELGADLRPPRHLEERLVVEVRAATVRRRPGDRRRLLLREVTSVEGVDLVLLGRDREARTLERVPGDRREPAVVVQLQRAAVGADRRLAAPLGQRPPGDHMEPGPAGRDLDEGVEERLDDRLGPGLDVAGLRIAAVIDVDEDAGDLLAEHEPDAVVPAGQVGRERLVVGAPRLGVGRAGLPSAVGLVRYLGPSRAVPRKLPGDPTPIGFEVVGDALWLDREHRGLRCRSGSHRGGVTVVGGGRDGGGLGVEGALRRVGASGRGAR